MSKTQKTKKENTFIKTMVIWASAVIVIGSITSGSIIDPEVNKLAQANGEAIGTQLEALEVKAEELEDKAESTDLDKATKEEILKELKEVKEELKKDKGL